MILTSTKTNYSLPILDIIHLSRGVHLRLVPIHQGAAQSPPSIISFGYILNYLFVDGVLGENNFENFIKLAVLINSNFLILVFASFQNEVLFALEETVFNFYDGWKHQMLCL